ncbi:hypothetical protein GH714_007082 [Hevea brasiliensis]|uniref:Uncharacterized protein n=1 Tax=Hevea brasiliensis TaxID=3981 RepID=A0A6A6KA01_HEVBR|nr:hypothetical protein GH714_007082 [Hevea brasiliensis]
MPLWEQANQCGCPARKSHGKRSSSPEKEHLDRKLIHHTRKSFGDVIIKGYHIRTRYFELKMGDPARNITEMIFHRASASPSKPSRKIRRVFRVKNSIEILESEKSIQVSELCKDPTCRVCRMIQCNFDTEYTRKNGIRLSTNSEELSENMINLSKLKMERAAIVCRIIAGTVVNKVNNRVKEECESIESETQYAKSESLILNQNWGRETIFAYANIVKFLH